MARAKKEATEQAAPRGRAPNPAAQNGVSPPNAGTASAAVWAACDKLAAKAESGNPVMGEVLAEVAKKKLANVDALRKSMGLPRLSEMEESEVERFLLSVSRAEYGDRIRACNGEAGDILSHFKGELESLGSGAQGERLEVLN